MINLFYGLVLFIALKISIKTVFRIETDLTKNNINISFEMRSWAKKIIL